MWEIDLAGQITAFLESLLIGGALGLIFYSLESVYTVFDIKGPALVCMDICFFVFAGFLTFCLLLITTNGEPRAFVIVGELIGFSVFKLLLSRLIKRLLCLLLGLFRKGFLYLLRAIFKPMQKILQKSRKILKKIAFGDKKCLKNGE